MIIAKIDNPNLTTQLHSLHPDFNNTPIKTKSTYHLDEKYSEYCMNNDVILYNIGQDKYLSDRLDSFFPVELLEKIKSKQALLAIDLSEEAFYRFVDKIYKHIVVEQNIPAEQILLISHSFDLVQRIETISKQYNLSKIKYECYSFWERVHKKIFLETMKNFGVYTTEQLHNFKSGLYHKTSKKFICLNNAWREHRLALLCLLKGNNLIQQGHVSFSLPIPKKNYYTATNKNSKLDKQINLHISKDIIEENYIKWFDNINTIFNIEELLDGKNLIDDLPMILDNGVFNQLLVWGGHNHLLKYYRDSYFSVTTETSFFKYIPNNALTHYLYEENDTPIFITEKLFKSISYKHPFIHCSIEGSLDTVRKLGYKTYDGIIDESYDRESNPNIRLQMIVKEVNRLCNLKEEELLRFKIDSQTIAEYNFNTFLNKENFIYKLI